MKKSELEYQEMRRRIMNIKSRELFDEAIEIYKKREGYKIELDEVKS